ncbi:hypothetical protein Ancab_004581, partial [Ancistrocladus abbreviatus]
METKVILDSMPIKVNQEEFFIRITEEISGESIIKSDNPEAYMAEIPEEVDCCSSKHSRVKDISPTKGSSRSHSTSKMRKMVLVTVSVTNLPLFMLEKKMKTNKDLDTRVSSSVKGKGEKSLVSHPIVCRLQSIERSPPDQIQNLACERERQMSASEDNFAEGRIRDCLELAFQDSIAILVADFLKERENSQ